MVRRRRYAVWVWESSLNDWALEGKGYSKQRASERAARYRRNYPGSHISIRDESDGKPPSRTLQENPTNLTPWLIGAAAVGGILLLASSSKGSSVSNAPPPEVPPPVTSPPPSNVKCEVDLNTAYDFAKSEGYHLFWKPDTLAKLSPPKSDYTGDSTSRAFAAGDCKWARWTGSKWVEDTKTRDEFTNYLGKKIFGGTSGHPADMFLFG